MEGVLNQLVVIWH